MDTGQLTFDLKQGRSTAFHAGLCCPSLDVRLADCMDVMRAAADDSWDIAIVDPPYGRGEDGGTNRNHGVRQRNGAVLQCRDGGYAAKKWDRATPPAEYFEQLRRVSKNQIVWGINYYPVSWPGGRIIWDKVNDGADQSGAEIAYCSLNQRVDVVRYMWRGMMQGVSIAQGTIQQGNKALNEKRIHPTQKPVKLYEWLLDTYTKPGDRILDTHMGSGSIAIAAHYRGRHLTACEIDPDYYAAALERIERETRQLSLFSSDNT
jgi:site-specific DNA-methyltransferase (adenine-specific)